MTQEKTRIIIIAVILFCIFLIVCFLDGWFTVMSYEKTYKDGYIGLRYWTTAMGIMLSMIGVGMGLASLFGDYGNWSMEDVYALILLGAMPWILIMGGLLDTVSYTVQNYYRGIPLMSGCWSSLSKPWPWLDPSKTYGVPMISYVVSRALEFDATVTVGVLAGSAISLVLVFSLWLAYYLDA